MIGALIGGAIFAINFTKEPPYILTKVKLSQTYQEYFINEQFDVSGLYLELTYSNGKGGEYTKKEPLSLRYFRNEEGITNMRADYYNNTAIVFSVATAEDRYYSLGFVYGGLKNEEPMTIKVKNKEVNGFTVMYTNGLFKLENNDIISAKNLIALVDYSNYNSESLNLKEITLEINGIKQKYYDKYNDEIINGFIVDRPTNTQDSTIKISYDKYSIELEYDISANGFVVVSSSQNSVS